MSAPPEIVMTFAESDHSEMIFAAHANSLRVSILARLFSLN